jgi:hypothetical protein
MSFRANLSAKLDWNWTDGAVDASLLSYAKTFDDGNDENEAEAIWHEEAETLLSGASTTLDLTALTRTVLGDTLTTTFLTIKGIFIVVTADSEGQLVVGGAAADEWSYPWEADGDKSDVPPDSPWLVCNRQWGWAVDASHKNLKLAASGGDVTYSIVIWGTTSTSASGSSGT